VGAGTGLESRLSLPSFFFFFFLGALVSTSSLEVEGETLSGKQLPGTSQTSAPG
jgi:hypothetical protein